MRGEKLLVDPRFVMKTVEVRLRDKFNKVAIAGLVFGEQSKMIGGIALVVRPVLDRTRGHVGLAADDWFNVGVRSGLIKFDRPVQISVIGDGHGRHFEFRGFFHKLFHPHRSIEEGIFRVEVKVNEGTRRHPSAL
jgi:hypothetical protein